MQILNETDKRDFLETLDALDKIIPVMDMDDRDFTASVLYRMAKTVREYGPSHGVSLNSHISDGLRAPYVFIDELATAKSSRFDAFMHQVIKETAAHRFKARLTEADIDRVIYNPPATVVYWKDGTKTVVKCSDHDLDADKLDPETGLVYAIAKKVLGNKSNYNNVLRRLIKGAKKS